MKANEAIEKLKIRQEEMMREANEMERRAKELQAIAECQDPQGGGYRWKVVEVDLSHDKMKANRIRLICERSHVQIDALLNHPQPPLTIMSGDDDIALSDYLSEGDEEE
jgi:hypothetical protein